MSAKNQGDMEYGGFFGSGLNQGDSEYEGMWYIGGAVVAVKQIHAKASGTWEAPCVVWLKQGGTWYKEKLYIKKPVISTWEEIYDGT